VGAEDLGIQRVERHAAEFRVGLLRVGFYHVYVACGDFWMGNVGARGFGVECVCVGLREL
jgi:hypothetical protein